MSKTITLKGSLEIGGDQCSTGCDTAGDKTVRALSLRCTQSYFQGADSTDIPIQISTAGAIGDAWVELPSTSDLETIEFLMVRSDQPVRLRIGAGPAVASASGATFPTGFSGGETLTFDLDGTSVSVVFTSGAQTAAQCANEINAACALLGLATPVASVSTTGQLKLTGVLTGVDGSVSVTGGTGRAALGFAIAEVFGTGEDVDVRGLYMQELPQPSTVTRVQISGQATISVVAAGRTTA